MRETLINSMDWKTNMETEGGWLGRGKGRAMGGMGDSDGVTMVKVHICMYEDVMKLIIYN